MSLTGTIQSIFGGIGVGAIYALLGLSFALIFGRLNIASVLHGDLAILAAYLIYFFYTNAGINLFIVTIALLPIFYFLGYIIQLGLLRPFMSLDVWKGRYQGQVMVTQGTAMIIMALEFMVWTGTYRTLGVPYRNSAINLGSLKLSIVHLMSFVALICLVLILNYILDKTRYGISLRACSDDRTTAMLTGIDYNKISNVSFGISAVISVVAGLFYALSFALTPSLGMDLTLKGWVAVIVGGMGSISGIVVAGLLVGLVESLSSYFWIPAYKDAVLFIGLLIFLVVKPAGLMAKK
ncbi:branched-chain amino acid ABC transporter permease [Microaceticoccus formicicus]|uniref:branched-chain amino acid ABC transporter permease n=1 Tax=Microaceticoccus formicicus TaxID=3118105 RepID=UPI003CD01D91|nr:branched-chain amino acid ABC transporter permease [Peptoniphilaceae bacterium AMB_02]